MAVLESRLLVFEGIQGDPCSFGLVLVVSSLHVEPQLIPYQFPVELLEP